MNKPTKRARYLVPLLSLLIICMAACKRAGSQACDFAAYYTSYGQPDEITGPFADVVVRFPDGKKLVFSRESSYLPLLEYGDERWFFEEIIPRSGDGDAVQPDRHNKYSYVRIIESKEEEVLIHWRYVSDFAQPGFAGIVHEYYVVSPDGLVSRTIQPGQEKLPDFTDPGNTYTEKLKLKHNGIRQLSFQEPVPVIHKIQQANRAVVTPLPSIYQAGQWTYSPAGVPMSILTGKLAAKRILKTLKQ